MGKASSGGGTAWDRYLARLDGEQQTAAVEWIASRPPEVQSLFRRFPPGSAFAVNGRTAYIVGVTETTAGPGLLLSHTDPAEDYKGAVESRFFVCATHLG